MRFSAAQVIFSTLTDMRKQVSTVMLAAAAVLSVTFNLNEHLRNK